jgi:lipoprotein-anchoring transpeptidase ErfK/SrfK
VATTAIPSWVPAKCRNANGKNGQVICVGIKSWQMVALQDHKVFLITAARHGAEGIHGASNGDRNLPTRRGTYKIYAKYTDKVSTLYRVHMPYFMPFSGGQGIHYSSEYASGYRYSHGCVGLKSLSKARQLFNWAKVGTTVIVVDA